MFQIQQLSYQLNIWFL